MLLECQIQLPHTRLHAAYWLTFPKWSLDEQMHALAAMTLYLPLFFVHAANAETHSLFAHSLYSIFEMNGVNLSKNFWCTGVRDQVLSVCVCVSEKVCLVFHLWWYIQWINIATEKPQNERQNETVRVREYQSIITWCICLAWLLWVVFHPRKLNFVNSQKETCLCSYPILLPHGRFVSLTLCTTLIFVQMACASGMFY